ncbi:hypothetical protein JQX13_44390 [Archangium violaceum]|uniref:hypothetical protein n=1 Tax=Archangium violaceum TaxID=83451 RepID=UPI00193C7FDF|nr:hypothetical protein [Archangium violaceum]QRK07026.1 hypothetical protein JQX13_44390 [Archangium violaceum]
MPHRMASHPTPMKCLRAARPLLRALLLLSLASACGPVDPPAKSREAAARTQALDALRSSPNGLAFNGLAFNGLAFNGLAFNGLAFNGLSSAEFSSWFQTAPELGDMVMKYLVQCAVPSGQTRSYTAPDTGITYTWTGNLGLAPGWSRGTAATLDEQQLISACLAAHTNKYGIHVPLSVLGPTTSGAPIPYSAEELASFPEKEGCFFGNLFTDEGVFVGNDGQPLHMTESSTRACALSSAPGRESQPCPPIVRVEPRCDRFCEKDATQTFYVRCTYEGISYRPLTTRISRDDIFVCGDGVCQDTESCGTGVTPNDCSDCGPCS